MVLFDLMESQINFLIMTILLIGIPVIALVYAFRKHEGPEADIEAYTKKEQEVEEPVE